MSQKYSRRDFIKAGVASAVAASPLLGASCALFKDFDLIIVGGLIYDGSGRPAITSDVGIKNGRIAEFGELRERSAGRKLEASGLAVAPGFIDFLSHSDDELLLAGEAQSKIRQGVTTEVLGQDGESMAPLNEEMQQELGERLHERYRLQLDWHDFAGYFRRLESSGLITNAASMIGQGTVREYVVGNDNRPAAPEEIERMRNLVREAAAQGAYGLSSGLEYTPGSFASTGEIIEIGRALGKSGIYSTHMRNEDDTVLEAIDEAIDIARASGVALNISHLKASGQRNWHKLPDILARLDAARTSGMRVTCDRYPYVAYNTGLSSLFPLWSRDGGRRAFVERLQNPSLRDSLRTAVMKKIDKIGGWQSVMISSLPRNPQREKFEGKRFAELAGDDAEQFSLLIDLVIAEDGRGDMVGFAMSEENTAAILAYPFCMPASDASSLATTGRLARGNPHPRAFGTFPRVLGKYVREDKLLARAEAIRKMTSLPAGALGLNDRGYLKIGYWADVVIFDPHAVADRATWSQPQQYPAGIPYVIVNGQVIIDQEKFTGKLAGRVLRKTL